jgi:hypothetical protein
VSFGKGKTAARLNGTVSTMLNAGFFDGILAEKTIPHDMEVGKDGSVRMDKLSEWVKTQIFTPERATALVASFGDKNSPTGLIPDTPDALAALKAEFVIADMAEDGSGFAVRSIADASKTWTVECKVTLPELHTNDFVWRIVAAAVMFKPGGDVVTISIQHDSHRAGSNLIGLVATCAGSSILFAHVSADMGCGITVVPMGDYTPAKQRAFLEAARRAIIRGGKAESDGDISALRMAIPAMRYLNTPARAWGKVMYKALSMTGTTDAALRKFVTDPKTAGDVARLAELIGPGADPLHAAAIAASMTYGGSLGCSGNHFAEYAVDKKTGKTYVVCHTGSRALGARIYAFFQDASSVNGTPGIVTGDMAIRYAEATEAMNTFASVNRAICALSILTEMGEPCDPDILRADVIADVARRFPAATPEQRERIVATAILGTTHNTTKAFVFEDAKGAERVAITVCKGSVVESRACGTVISALRPGDGSLHGDLWNPEIVCTEVTVADALRMAESGTATLCNDIGEIRRCVYIGGHGAGRNGSASDTTRRFSFEQLVKFAFMNGYEINVGANSRGDNPFGYKDPARIAEIFLKEAGGGEVRVLRTLANFKEGLSKGQKILDVEWAEWWATLLATALENGVNDAETAHAVRCVDWAVARYNKRWDRRFKDVVDAANSDVLYPSVGV